MLEGRKGRKGVVRKKEEREEGRKEGWTVGGKEWKRESKMK